MKRLLYILLVFPNLFFAQVYRAKLVDYDASKIPAYCGYQKSYGVLKFELQEKSRKGEVVFIVQECPRELMEKVGEYKNDSIYSVSIGDQVNKKLREIGIEICKRNYPKDKTKIFWVGFIKH
ncbi:hypothetical protein HYN48_13300 [Flavobacterium magnum]|uniref:Uncharacterized protein n=1 Tax=Flavobacterium magnum TaxID=2162713 RepID=A0A2S0RH47_9FLAO|nr:hypothetical protein [Flavobacterium magnum]AWA30976.1 hypothetical protein HYN48_13300 [Flavobacterium magnum]